MKAILIIVILIALSVCSFAQEIPRQSIEDTELGWMKIYNFNGVSKPVKVDDKLYSSAQIAICDLIANWIQASYTPKGGLGDVKKAVSEKLGLYNQNLAALPQSYGAYARIYIDLKYDSNRKIIPATNSHIIWTVMANGVYGEPADALNTPTQYYFTLPSFAEQGYGDELEKAVDLSRHPVLKRFPAYFQRNSVNGNRKYLLLTKDNKSPFVKITKGEYLQIIEAAINRSFDEETKKIYRDNKDSQQRVNIFLKNLDAKNEKRLATLKNNKEKYKNRLKETAEIFSAQPDAMLENYSDVFEGNGGSSLKLPVYKIDPAMAELCKKDTPQWIVVSWTASLNEPVNKYLHEAVINNFNFEYIYNYFFYPEKVQGKPYKQLLTASHKEEIKVAEASDANKRNAADKNIHFFEDFSAADVGKKPIGWRSNLANDGSSSVVTKLDGLDGNWASMNGFRIVPTQLKTPLPQNFTLSYELSAAQNYTWGAKGLIFQLSKETTPGNAESFISLKLRPGFDGRDGEATIETKFPSPPGYSSGTKWFAAAGFSNNKKNNRITVTIKKSGETLQVFIDKTKIVEYENAIPPSLLFNAMSFTLQGNGTDEKMFVSNIKITKD